MDLKDEITDQSLDDITKTDVSTNDKCTNDVTKDEITSPDVTETIDKPVTDADVKEVTETVADGVNDSAQGDSEAAILETNGTPAESEIPAQDAEIETKIAQKSESRTETDNSEEHTVSQASESNLEQTSNGHMSIKQDDEISIDSLDENSENQISSHNENQLNQSDDEEIGMSNQMCPENEIKFRVENNLIHRIEEGKFMIKEYRRSAADTNDLDSPQNLRTKSALAKTVSYLLTSVMRSQEFSFFDKYNFIFDRLRSVRQELTIQRLSHSWFGLKILIGCCNFYLVSRRIFVDTKEDENFIDLPKFNEQHLHECIGTIIDFMKELSEEELFGTEISTTREAIAILLLSSFDQLRASNIILNFIFSILSHLKTHNILVNPMILFKSYHMNNWTRFSRVFHRLSRIQQITVEPYVKNIRKKCLQGCAIAYHNQKLPLNLLCSWLLVIQEDLVAIINESPGLEIKIGDSGDALVQFNKKEFNLENIPEDLLSTPASGTLSQHVLYDMCQVSEYESEVTDLAPQIANVSLQDNTDEYSSTKDVVSINPLDVARSSTDEEDVPIWMRKSKTERRNRKNNRDRRGKNNDEDLDRRIRHQSDRSNRDRTRKTSHRSRERPRDENRRPPNDDRYSDNRKRNRGNRNRRDRSGENRDRGTSGRGKKPGSTAARSWQHDDRTRTTY